MTKKLNTEIETLTPYQHIRLKTEMYMGSRSPHTQDVILYDDNLKPYIKETTWVPALYTVFREVIDNSLDEIIAHGHGDKIEITFNKEKFEFSVKDNGRGIPIEYDDSVGQHKVTTALTNINTGRNFRERGEGVGSNGVGCKGTIFTSRYASVEVTRDNKKFTQKFSENIITNELNIEEPKIIDVKSEASGTKITFRPSNIVFEDTPKIQNNLILPEEFIKSRVIEIAITNPSLKVYYNGERIKVDKNIQKSLFNDLDVVSFEIEDDDFRTVFYVVPDFGTETKFNEFHHSLVNNIPAFNGGLHIDGFRRSFYKGLISSLERESKRKKLYPNNSDIQTNLLVFNITNMKAPNFDSQSKTRLINDISEKIVKKYFENDEIYKKIIRKHKSWIESIYERCAHRTNKKDADELNKLNKRLKKAKIAKLLDATSKDRSKCTIFIAEGASAKGGILNARNPELHAALDLRGKVMNVHDEPPKKVLENKELADIMNAIGLQIGKKAIREELQYGNVYIACDMDLDGFNIAALLINFFYTYWPELFEDKEKPFVNIFQTPYLIGKQKGKTDRKYWYGDNYEDYSPEKYPEYKITRAKGLGALEKQDWQHCLANPRLTPIIDDGFMKETLDLIFNNKKANDRKIWMGI